MVSRLSIEKSTLKQANLKFLKSLQKKKLKQKSNIITEFFKGTVEMFKRFITVKHVYKTKHKFKQISYYNIL